MIPVVLSKSTWRQHGIPLTCDVTVCSYVIIKNDLDNTMTNNTLELISGTSTGTPAAILSKTEELIFMKKSPFVALGVVGVLHYRIDGYNATVNKGNNYCYSVDPPNLKMNYNEMC
jgi:hypothetical protein